MPTPFAGKSVLQTAATLLAAYLVLLVLLRLFEKHFVFFPNYPGRLTGEWAPAELAVQDVGFTARDGVKLHGWWIASPGARFTFVAFHGNAGNVAYRAEVYAFLRDLPANVLAVEYRGYGRSEGSADEPGVYRDADAAYDYLVSERGVPPRRLIAFGQSLGSAVAADLAARREVGGVVLEAPFASAKAVARRAYPFLPGLGLALGTKLDTGAKLKRVRAPVLVVHCARDPVIPFALGEEVFRLANEPKSLLRLDGFCHEEASMVDPERYRDELRAFLSRIRLD